MDRWKQRARKDRDPEEVRANKAKEKGKQNKGRLSADYPLLSLCAGKYP